MRPEQFFKLSEINEFAECGRESGRVAADKPAADEFVDQLLLPELLLNDVRVVEGRRNGRRLSIKQQIRQAALTVAGECVLELPLSTGHLAPRDRSAELV